MMDEVFKKEIKQELIECVDKLRGENSDIILISLCTTDGFSIRSFANIGVDVESDKIAAISSTICALSGSAAKELSDEEFDTTIIETQSDNILFVSTQYLGADCVLTLVAKPHMALAMARFCTRRLAESIRNIS